MAQIRRLASRSSHDLVIHMVLSGIRAPAVLVLQRPDHVMNPSNQRALQRLMGLFCVL